MNWFQKILRIIYPLIIWLGTIGIPVLVATAFVMIVDKEGLDSEGMDTVLIFGLIGLAVSSPYFLLFCVVYYLFLFIKKINRYIKPALLICNMFNIFTSLILVEGFGSGPNLTMLVGGSVILLLPSTLLILFIRIPTKKEMIASDNSLDKD